MFHQAWDRFGQLSLDCSEHDFDGDHLLQLFLTGLRPETLDFVQSMSWGDFTEYTTEESWHALQAVAEYERTLPSDVHPPSHQDDGQSQSLDVVATPQDHGHDVDR